MLDLIPNERGLYELAERHKPDDQCKMTLAVELETYHNRLSELAADEGKFVLIHGPQVIDVYGTYEDAIKDGYARFKLEPFLVKQIHAVEQVQFVSRLLNPCHT